MTRLNFEQDYASPFNNRIDPMDLMRFKSCSLLVYTKRKYDVAKNAFVELMQSDPSHEML